MNFTINVDTGGTFTDGFFTSDCGLTRSVKVDSTPQDLTVCFRECLEQGAKVLGLTEQQLLAATRVIRYSTTVGTNTVIQKKGPKLGLIVSPGNAELAKGIRYVSPDLVAVLDEMVDERGCSIKAPNDDDVRKILEQLLDNGARAIVVCLLNSYANPIHEVQVKRAIQSEFPRHYLGAVRVFTANGVTMRPGEKERLGSVILTAYLHEEVARYLYRAEDHIRNNGCRFPLLIAHSSGGVARVAKTSALHTYNSGPVAGLKGGGWIARNLYDLDSVITIDIGGTSFDVGALDGGNVSMNSYPRLEEVAINIPMVEVNTIGAGGGSIARVDPVSGKLSVGPDSAGAMPGPVAYDLGGTDVTVTDANLILGYINPDYFLGGRRRLNLPKAAQAIEEQIARPLGVRVHEAAYLIKEEVEANMARAVMGLMKSKGLKAQTPLFVYGGAGGMHCAGLAKRLDNPLIYLFPFSPVFSAFGVSTMDANHLYEAAVKGSVHSETIWSLATDLSEVARQLAHRALRDMVGEGFKADEVRFVMELELTNPRLQFFTVSELVKGQDWQPALISLLQRIATESSDSQLTILRLQSVCEIPHPQFPIYSIGRSDPSAALKDVRSIYWGNGQFVDTSVFERDRLVPGNVIQGPAIVEAADTNYIVSPKARFTVDRYQNYTLEV